MKLMKNILIHILIILIILMACFSVYYSSKYELPVFADSNTQEWTQVTTNQELAEAFRYYCKSRNLAIEGSVFDALTTFTTNSFNTICNTLGIDVTALQAHIKRSTDSNGRLQFLFDQTGITAFNRIFAEFLQNNDLEVGDEVAQKNLYSGRFYTDDQGNTALVFEYNYDNSGAVHSGQTPTAKGSYYIYPYEFFTTNSSSLNRNFSFLNTSYSMNISYDNSDYKISNSCTFNNYFNSTFCFYKVKSTQVIENRGYPCIAFNTANNSLRAGVYSINNNTINTKIILKTNPTNTELPPCIVFITTNNNTINNNTYNDNRQTVINNEGDVYNYDTDNEPPINPPSGGGGGTITPPTDSGGNDGDVTFPDFNFQLPQIDWSLGDLHDKFPFSIPFDLVEFLTVLNAEPITPEFAGDLNLGILTHHFEFDLHQFDGLAQLLRAMEFIGFCIGLIFITRQMLRV